MKLESVCYSKPGGLTKQACIYGNAGCIGAPLVYLQRPKWIKDDFVWEEITRSLSLNLPLGFEVR